MYAPVDAVIVASIEFADQAQMLVAAAMIEITFGNQHAEAVGTVTVVRVQQHGLAAAQIKQLGAWIGQRAGAGRAADFQITEGHRAVCVAVIDIQHEFAVFFSAHAGFADLIQVGRVHALAGAIAQARHRIDAAGGRIILREQRSVDAARLAGVREIQRRGVQGGGSQHAQGHHQHFL